MSEFLDKYGVQILTWIVGLAATIWIAIRATRYSQKQEDANNEREDHKWLENFRVELIERLSAFSDTYVNWKTYNSDKGDQKDSIKRTHDRIDQTNTKLDETTEATRAKITEFTESTSASISKVNDNIQSLVNAVGKLEGKMDIICRNRK
jgi:hypothetical protein